MKTILQFIKHLKLDKGDEQVLLQHIEECHATASGPGLNDKCSDRVRRYLKSRPLPPGLSWNAALQLEEALNAGFTSKQAHKIGIPSIGIVAVLVANVTFIAWATPPGGPTPYWLGCDYPMFTAFLIVNGIAFMLAVASAVVVTAFPLVLSRTPHQAAWWGGILLMLSMLAFIVAFLMAGFVTVGYQAPPPSCSSIRCTEGGIACSFDSYPSPEGVSQEGEVLSSVFYMDTNVAALNAISNSTSAGVCVTYNRSVSYGTYSTLLPWVPEISYSSSNYSSTPEFTEAITQLLTDPLIQAETVCMDVNNLPVAIDPRADPETLAVNISFAIPGDLGLYLMTNQYTIMDILPNSSYTQLKSLANLNYFCLSHETEEKMKFDVLCDASTETAAGNLSVGRSGEYIRAVTAAETGAVLFDTDLTAQQVSKAIKALAGVFAFILLVIVIFLIKSKFF